jgi:hypothetical protein
MIRLSLILLIGLVLLTSVDIDAQFSILGL